MRWGIAGHGDIVTRRALPALRALGEEPAVLWGRDAHRAARVAERYGVPRSGADPGVLLRGVDAVYVATPVAAHVPLAAAALDAGLPVLVEKPLAGGLGSPGLGGGGLGRGGGPAWRCAGVAYYRRLAPAVRRLRAELRGWTPERVEVRFRCAFAPGPDDPMRWRTDPAVSGGGVLADAGSHRVDLLLHLFGRPLEVSARLTDRFPAGAERRADLTLRWPHGLTARCVMAWGEGAPVDRLELHGAGRTVTLDPLDEGRLAGLDVRGGGRLAGLGRGEEGAPGADSGVLLLPPFANPHQPLFADFAEAVGEGRAPVCPLAEGRLVDDVIVAAGRSSAAGGRPTPLRCTRP
ncbi:Gfo/Idh/MocA family protein [Streptomyces alfalfae]|uniref:Gfo/Idh/MocA family protein n=1 Tax=Streptomyces alfalfae TaxID=1642299 RepID=UPI001BA97C72|nr:Gfo/Idh/MocA family oxidoreductase [Streptomyces alfalfae]QUI34897.1 Gfo/Idh/MocA family oxidoreductase [Streptomyces alfalfae]